MCLTHRHTEGLWGETEDRARTLPPNPGFCAPPGAATQEHTARGRVGVPARTPTPTLWKDLRLWYRPPPNLALWSSRNMWPQNEENSQLWA